MPAPRRAFVLSFLPALAALLVTSAGRAEEPAKPFGERGQVALDDVVALSAGGNRLGYPLVLPIGSGVGSMGVGFTGILGYSRDETSRFSALPGGHASKSETVWIAPSADVFVGGHFSVGGTIAASYARGASESVRLDGKVERSAGSGYGFAIAPRVGYVIPLGTSFALWPRLTIGFNAGSSDYNGNMFAAHFLSWNRSVLGAAELGLVARIHRRVYLRAAPELVIGFQQSLHGHPGIGSGQDESRSLSVRVGATAGLGFLLGS